VLLVMTDFFQWLTANQVPLGILGLAIVAVVSGFWAWYTHSTKKDEKAANHNTAQQTNSGLTSGRDISIEIHQSGAGINSARDTHINAPVTIGSDLKKKT
jgi:hypothetical protein